MARRQIPVTKIRSTAPPPNRPPSDGTEWRTRVGCKRSAPPLNSKKKQQQQYGTSVNNLSPKGGNLHLFENSCSSELRLSARGASYLRYDSLLAKGKQEEELHLSHQEETVEIIPDLHLPNKGDTADNDVSMSYKGNWGVSMQCGISEDFLPKSKRDDLHLQNSRSTELHLSARRASYMPNMHPQHDTMTAEELNEEENREMIPDLQEPNKVVTTDNGVTVSEKGNWSMSLQCGTSENNFSPKRNDVYLQNTRSTELHLLARHAAYLPDMHPQHDTPKNNYSAIGGGLHVPPKYITAEELNEDDEASDAGSQVDRWVCRVCKEAVVSIVVLPCSHLCLCWDCEPRTDDCPDCGQAKSNVFYINF